MDKINPINFNQQKYENVKKEETGSNNKVEINELPKNSLEEAIGRSQVNFRAIPDKIFKLTLEDKKFIDVIRKVFKLNDEEVKSIEDYTKKFLEEKNMKSFSAMKSDDIFEFANEQAVWAENVSRKLNLSDYESTDLDWIMTAHINTGDVTKFRNHFGETITETFKYSRDYTPIRDVLERNEVEEAEIGDIIRTLGLYSRNNQLDSIFDLFKKGSEAKGDGTLSILLHDAGVSNDRINDILIDMHSLASKSKNERLNGINIHAIEEQFNDGINTLTIAGEIDKRFNTGITKELLEMLETRKTDTVIHQDGKSLQEVAYRIADKHNLPSGADKEIIEIINAHTVPDSKEKIKKLIDVLKKDDGANIEFP